MGRVGRLRGDLFHYTVRTVKEHNAKLEVFTDKAAEDLYARGRRRWRAGMVLAALPGPCCRNSCSSAASWTAAAAP
jgi:hypothetical protein